jgi:hypothetical protein
MMWLPSKRLFTDTFLNMCRMTTPHGYEPFVWAFLPIPPRGAAPDCGPGYRKAEQWIDDHGNWHVWVPYPPGYDGPNVMWASHCDTADRDPTAVKFVWDGDLVGTDKKSILGADDKTGVTIMCMMIRAGVPGHYVFFCGEEVGCIGSKALAKECEMGVYDCCISLDRKGYTSIITHQCGSRTASDSWAAELAGRLNDLNPSFQYSPDNTGVFTDSREFSDVIPECTNISVGYFKQHTNDEQQDVEFAYDLCIALILLCRDGYGIPMPSRNPALEMDEDNYGYSWLFRKSGDPDTFSEDEWKRRVLDDMDDKDWWHGL